MLLAMLARVEIEFHSIDQSSQLGLVVLFLFLLALVGFVCLDWMQQDNSACKNKTPSLKDKAPSLSDILIDLEPTVTLSPGNLNLPNADRTARRSRATGRERRESVRREGNPLPIMLSDPSDGAISFEGTVLDRSRGGLLISSPEVRAAGAILRVRPKDAPEDIGWVDVQVRHSRQKQGRWLLGCAFTRKLDWCDLLIFG